MITISPGHWHIGTGAVGIIDEVAEARKVVAGVVYHLKQRGIFAHTVVDTRSKNQRENLLYIVNNHNATVRKLDVSIHFNAVAGKSAQPIGTEVLHKNEPVLAQKVSAAIAKASGLKNRGAKKRSDLAFLNGVKKRAILIEVCFVNSAKDVALYQQFKRAICVAIADVLANEVLS